MLAISRNLGKGGGVVPWSVRNFALECIIIK